MTPGQLQREMCVAGAEMPFLMEEGARNRRGWRYRLNAKAPLLLQGQIRFERLKSGSWHLGWLQIMLSPSDCFKRLHWITPWFNLWVEWRCDAGGKIVHFDQLRHLFQK